MTWYVTFLFIFSEGGTVESVESFAYEPSARDIDEVGQELAAQFGATDFVASRGKKELEWRVDRL